MFPLLIQAMLVTFVLFALTLKVYWLVALGLAVCSFFIATVKDLTRSC